MNNGVAEVHRKVGGEDFVYSQDVVLLKTIILVMRPVVMETPAHACAVCTRPFLLLLKGLGTRLTKNRHVRSHTSICYNKSPRIKVLQSSNFRAIFKQSSPVICWSRAQPHSCMREKGSGQKGRTSLSSRYVYCGPIRLQNHVT